MRTRTGWVGIVIVALALGACGDDDSTPEAGSTAGEDEFCTQAGELAIQIAASVEAGDDLSDEDLVPGLQEQIAILEELEAAAPSEIRADVETLVGVANETLALLQDDGASGDDEDDLTRLDELNESAADPRSNVEAFVSDECGIDLDPTADGGSGSSDSEDTDVPKPPDPCRLASADEVEAIIGLPVEPTDFTGDGTFDEVRSVSCTFNASTDGGLVTVSISTLSFDDPDAVREAYQAFGETTDADIDGLPPSSFRTLVEGLVTTWVVDAATPYGVSVSTTEGAERTDLPVESEALALALYEPA